MATIGPVPKLSSLQCWKTIVMCYVSLDDGRETLLLSKTGEKMQKSGKEQINFLE